MEGNSFDLSKLKTLFATPEVKFLLSLLVGFLIGLEREIRGKLGQDVFAGIRTFPLIAGLGTLSAWISDKFYPHFLALSYLGVLSLSAVNYWIGVQKRSGITTEVAVFLTFTLGVLTYYGFYYEVILFAVVITLLLATKRVLESFASHLEVEDIFLILQFLTLSVLIYPILPDREILYGLNPKSVWKFVVIVSSLSFLGYFLLKLYTAKGETKGLVKSLLITALLGGSVSSTAVTLAFANLSRELPAFGGVLFLGIVVAWAVMGVRVVVLASIIAPPLFVPLLELFIPFLLIMLAIGFFAYRRGDLKGETDLQLGKRIKLKNPLSWGEIFEFALVYCAVSVLGKFLNAHFGEKGLIALSVTSGVIDIDPITIALANMFAQGQLALTVVLTGILLATISNNFFKALYAYIFGSELLKRYITLLVAGNILYALLGLMVLKWL